MTSGAGELALGVPVAVGPGRHVGRYQLLHEIATGGMATVYLGRARGAAGFERIVAVKVCHPHLRGDEDFASMFLDEARLAARIHHPNVVGTLDVGDDQTLYLVMEYIEGDRLSGLIKGANKRGQRVPVPVALRVMVETLAGLHAAHELLDLQGRALNMVHRDVSPQNILVGVDGVARITDFGIAKAEARVTVTREGQIKGKMAYMAPEQLASGPVTRRADLYAAGVVLWESLTGRRLFRADSDAETLNMVLHGVVPRPSGMIPEVSPELDALVLRALERDPEKRFATATEFAEALESGPHKVATTRVVSAYMNDLLGETLTRRREIIRALDQGGDLPPLDRVDISHSAVRVSTGAVLTAVERPAGRLESAPHSVVAPGSAIPEGLLAPALGRGVLYAAGGALAAVALGALVFALRPATVTLRSPLPSAVATLHAAARPAATEPPSTASPASITSPVVPSEPPGVPAVPVAVAAQDSPADSTVEVAEVTPALSSAGRHRGASHLGGRDRHHADNPRGEPGPGALPAAPASPPRSQPGEFHPGSI